MLHPLIGVRGTQLTSLPWPRELSQVLCRTEGDGGGVGRENKPEKLLEISRVLMLSFVIIKEQNV